MCPAPASRVRGTVMSPMLRRVGRRGLRKRVYAGIGAVQRQRAAESRGRTGRRAAPVCVHPLLRGDAKGCTQVRRRISGRKWRNHAAERGRGAAESAYTLLERKKRKGVRTWYMAAAASRLTRVRARAQNAGKPGEPPARSIARVSVGTGACTPFCSNLDPLVIA